jgi:hypothetical protein
MVSAVLLVVHVIRSKNVMLLRNLRRCIVALNLHRCAQSVVGMEAAPGIHPSSPCSSARYYYFLDLFFLLLVR